MLKRLPRPSERNQQRLTSALLAIVLLAGLAAFARVTHQHYPIQTWLFWRYLGYWALGLSFVGACLSSGHATVKAVLRGGVLPSHEHVAASFAIGLMLFSYAMFAVGIGGLLGTGAFIAVPLLLLLSGARPSYRSLKRWRRGTARYGGAFASTSALDMLALLFGLGALALIYFSILSPKNIAFDARWKHLALAQHYAAAGRIAPFPEGWVPASAPQLASRIYTWALTLPWGVFFDKIELAAHLEFFSFCVSLSGIVALVRRLVPQSKSSLSWVLRFSFPGIFLYDSSLSGGADHIAAVFTAPIMLALFRAYPRLDLRHCILLAFPIAGVIMTKYSAAFVLMALPVLALSLRSLSLAVMRLRGKCDVERFAWLKGPAACIGMGLLLTSVLWVKNSIWYHDPLYPLLHKHFPSAPWDSDASWLYQYSYRAQHWKPKALTWETVKRSLEVLATFSFVPHDWKRFHRNVPVFGSLFTLTLLAIPALGRYHVRGRKRLWAVVFAVHMGIMIWWWTHHQDRYLQVLVPWMTASLAAIVILLWRRGLVVRLALAALVAFQLIWGSDVFFIPGHAHARSPAKVSIDLAASGFQRKGKSRLRVFPFEKIAARLPPEAVVMLHEVHPHLGLQRQAVHDWVSWQAGINYGRLASPQAVDATYRRMRVSHLLFNDRKSRGYDSIASELLFRYYANYVATKRKRVGGWTIAQMPSNALAPDAPFNGRVLFLPCDRRYAGMLSLKDMHVSSFGPGRFRFPKPRVKLSATNGSTLVKDAGFLVAKRACRNRYKHLNTWTQQFRKTLRRKRFDLYWRNPKQAKRRSAKPPAPKQAPAAGSASARASAAPPQRR
jgi:hypothetical protein